MLFVTPDRSDLLAEDPGAKERRRGLSLNNKEDTYTVKDPRHVPTNCDSYIPSATVNDPLNEEEQH